MVARFTFAFFIVRNFARRFFLAVRPPDYVAPLLGRTVACSLALPQSFLYARAYPGERGVFLNAKSNVGPAYHL